MPPKQPARLYALETLVFDDGSLSVVVFTQPDRKVTTHFCRDADEAQAVIGRALKSLVRTDDILR